MISLNEMPNPQSPYVPKIVKPPDGAHTRIHIPVFPPLNSAVVHDVIAEGVAKQALNRLVISNCSSSAYIETILCPGLCETKILWCNIVQVQ